MGKKATNIFEEINLDSVPYMMTAGGQQFAKAWANMYISICGFGPTCANNAYTGGVQPFFEAALTPGSGYCATFTNCTAAVASKQLSNFQNTTVSAMWATLNAATGWTLGRTMLSSQATAFNTTTSLGFSNYNAAFVSLHFRDLHGFSGLANFTYGKSLGTGEIAQYNSSNEWLDNWNPRANYGPSVFDYRYLFNAGLTYKPTFFRGRHGWTGKVLDGWGLSPFLFIRSGVPILEVLQIVSQTVGNVIMEKAIKTAAVDIERGESISAALTKHPIFPSMILRMITAGEQTGRLDNMLERIADFLDEEIETTLAGLTALIEPILIVFLGIVIGGMVICMFLPIFKLPEIVENGAEIYMGLSQGWREGDRVAKACRCRL